jgi:hypothetical protein
MLSSEVKDDIHAHERVSYRDRIGNVSLNRAIRQRWIHDKIKNTHLVAAIDEAPRQTASDKAASARDENRHLP